MKDVEGYAGLYAVSETGRVWSYPKWHGKCMWPGFYLKQHQDGAGYLFVHLQKNGKRWQPKVHRLVAAAYLTQKDGATQVNHINGLKTDNRVRNLEWVTPSENIRHSFRIGLSSQAGTRNAASKLNDKSVRHIRLLAASGVKQSALAREYGVSRAVVNRVVKMKAWTHVG